MQVLYIAGPYRSSSEYDKKKNIDKAMDMARKIWLKGYAVVCPHANSMYLGLPYWTVISGDLELVRRSDAVFMLKGWEESVGANAEKDMAEKHDKKVYYRLQDVPNLRRKK